MKKYTSNAEGNIHNFIFLRILSLEEWINKLVVIHMLMKDKIVDTLCIDKRRLYFPPDMSILPPANCLICSGLEISDRFTVVAVSIKLTSNSTMEIEYNNVAKSRFILNHEINNDATLPNRIAEMPYVVEMINMRTMEL